ncbi:glucose-6-phosphate dehydrogenase [Acidipila sp. EB88]|uniref:glucose-6-phosphate dehydrogenase n=1 Tax=Acidipila sp. EB88 TaxID=2305226 RepID=UPI000F5FC8DB|nr:glucose-6-phosphate dehydrogenase [Acidipila sp. EB88]RRA47703.1 glucose-6-phosphate dehydrogenase [Acidipila sp. EB88]
MSNHENTSTSSQTQSRKPEPTVVVIFGASGDLTKRKLLPALFHLEEAGLLPEEFAVVGVARRDLSATFAPDMRKGILDGGAMEDDPKLASFVEKISYHTTNFDDSEGYAKLKAKLEGIDKEKGTKGNRLFYLAVAPEFFQEIVDKLGEQGMDKAQGDAHVRVIIEKPFGHDLESAKALNDGVAKVFKEEQIFRIDHYLGKETVQNIFVFRFGNALFEPLWNSEYIDNIQITAAESIGIEGRGPFYEKAGVSRDILQNHMMEMLAFVAMDKPKSNDAKDVIAEKVKLFKAIQPLTEENTVRGQYGKGTVDGKDAKPYREEDRVDPKSVTETFGAVKLDIDTPRWKGTPIYLRAGKRLAKRVTEVVIQFKQQANPILEGAKEGDCQGLPTNLIRLRIQPDEGIKIAFGNKRPTPDTVVCPVEASFKYVDAFGKYTANGYERLLLDAMLGDASLFTHRDAVETAWSLYTPLLEQWAKNPPADFPNYESGTWGPKASDELLAKSNHTWHAV